MQADERRAALRQLAAHAHEAAEALEQCVESYLAMVRASGDVAALERAEAAIAAGRRQARRHKPKRRKRDSLAWLFENIK
jgi:hypothetical protein